MRGILLYMGFFENIAEAFGLSEMNAEKFFRAALIGEEKCYLEGICAIKSYSSEKIELFLKKGGIKITGEKLIINKFCAGDVAVCGKIKSIERT